MNYCHECTQAGLEYELNLAGIPYHLNSDEIFRRFHVECQNKRFTIDFSQPVATLTYKHTTYRIHTFERIIDIIRDTLND